MELQGAGRFGEGGSCGASAGVASAFIRTGLGLARPNPVTGFALSQVKRISQSCR